MLGTTLQRAVSASALKVTTSFRGSASNSKGFYLLEDDSSTSFGKGVDFENGDSNGKKCERSTSNSFSNHGSYHDGKSSDSESEDDDEKPFLEKKETICLCPRRTKSADGTKMRPSLERSISVRGFAAPRKSVRLPEAWISEDCKLSNILLSKSCRGKRKDGAEQPSLARIAPIRRGSRRTGPADLRSALRRSVSVSDFAPKKPDYPSIARKTPIRCSSRRTGSADLRSALRRSVSVSDVAPEKPADYPSRTRKASIQRGSRRSGSATDLRSALRRSVSLGDFTLKKPVDCPSLARKAPIRRGSRRTGSAGED